MGKERRGDTRKQCAGVQQAMGKADEDMMAATRSTAEERPPPFSSMARGTLPIRGCAGAGNAS
jgi:hypothetical protein